MTAPVPDADTEALHGRLALAISYADEDLGAGIPAEELADALLPVVEAHARRVAADALRKAANDWAYLTERSKPVQRFLRARAAALAALAAADNNEERTA